MNLRVIGRVTKAGKWHIPKGDWIWYGGLTGWSRLTYCGHELSLYSSTSKKTGTARGICKTCLKAWRKEAQKGAT